LTRIATIADPGLKIQRSLGLRFIAPTSPMILDVGKAIERALENKAPARDPRADRARRR
jgi:hypothetical protein